MHVAYSMSKHTYQVTWGIRARETKRGNFGWSCHARKEMCVLREVLLFAGALASGTPVAAMATMLLTDLRSRNLAGYGIWQRAETGEI